MHCLKTGRGKLLMLVCKNLLVIGAVSFSMYAASYNRRFQYCKVTMTNDIDRKVKRIKRYVDNIAKVKPSQE